MGVFAIAAVALAATVGCRGRLTTKRGALHVTKECPDYHGPRG